jgi:septum formation protein
VPPTDRTNPLAPAAQPALVLASRSPRRLELLRLAGFDPVVRAADIDEHNRVGERPDAYVVRLAGEKALAVPRDGEEVVLGADTTVVLDGESLGKPADAEDATRLLRRLSGRAHHVLTGVVVAGASGPPVELLVGSEVRFAELDDRTIARYVATGEPLDKAGAYGIQGRGQVLVAEVRGSWTNIVGLPAVETLALLREAGVAPTG